MTLAIGQRVRVVKCDDLPDYVGETGTIRRRYNSTGLGLEWGVFLDRGYRDAFSSDELEAIDDIELR